MVLDTLIQSTDTLALQKNVLSHIKDTTSPLWEWVAIVEFVIIVFLVFRLLKAKTKQMPKELREMKNTQINTDDVVSDIFQSKNLYDKLIRICHPDRFPDETMKEAMTILSMEITKNKNSYSRLLSIKEETEKKYPYLFN